MLVSRRSRQPVSQVARLIAATAPLLELFAVVNDVFSEPNAFDKPDVTLGRIYRQWKEVCLAFDPTWHNPHGRDRG